MFKLNYFYHNNDFHSFDFHIDDKCHAEKIVNYKLKYFRIFPSFPIFNSVRLKTFKFENKKKVREIFFSKKLTNFLSIPSILIEKGGRLNSEKYLIFKLKSKFLNPMMIKKLNLLRSTKMRVSSFLAGETIFLLYSFYSIIPTYKLDTLVYVLQKKFGFILQKKLKN